MSNECDAVRQRYDRRAMKNWENIYSPLLSHSYLSIQEKERAIIRWINTCGIAPLKDKRLLEIGCGSGSNLLDMIRLGFKPENLVGNELLAERIAESRHRLPIATKIIHGDASEIDLSEESFDIVFQSTVFTSILNNDFQNKLADRMWKLTKYGGGVLWYDFIYNNPMNQDVKGIPISRIRKLFPNGKIKYWRLTLAPPIARSVCKIYSGFYTLFNLLPIFRTHVLCWIAK